MKRKIIIWLMILIGLFSINAIGVTSKGKKTSNNKKIVNIAFFGIDRLSEKVSGRSDSTMVITIDYARKKLKISSFMRDLYVAVPGHGLTKLTHAYAYGGPKLAVKTLNGNFGLDIKDYCTVDFFTFEKIIDSIGGIYINVKQDEIQYINSFASGMSKKKHKDIVKSGKQLLDGGQAVAYSRIRSIGSGDFDRTERQRTVLMSLINKVNSKGDDAVIDLVLKLKPYVNTNMSRDKIINIGTDYLSLPRVSVEEERFPVDGFWKNYTLKGVYYLRSDLGLIKKQVTDYIYHDKKPKKNNKK